jgi:hypothetical protein
MTGNACFGARLGRGVRMNELSASAIEFLEPKTDGRRHNELLGISYLIDTSAPMRDDAGTPRSCQLSAAV